MQISKNRQLDLDAELISFIYSFIQIDIIIALNFNSLKKVRFADGAAWMKPFEQAYIMFQELRLYSIHENLNNTSIHAVRLCEIQTNKNTRKREKNGLTEVVLGFMLVFCWCLFIRE